MDATKRPLVIPPNFSNYAESKEIFHLLQVVYCKFLGTHDINHCSENSLVDKFYVNCKIHFCFDRNVFTNG